jgi:hypothetical protein
MNHINKLFVLILAVIAIAGCNISFPCDLPDSGPAVEADSGSPVADAMVFTCPAGTAVCDGQCVNLAVDPTNCGTCGNHCGGGTVCTPDGLDVTRSSCQCQPGEVICGYGPTAVCANLFKDEANCGTCGHACATGEVCSITPTSGPSAECHPAP